MVPVLLSFFFIVIRSYSKSIDTFLTDEVEHVSERVESAANTYFLVSKAVMNQSILVDDVLRLYSNVPDADSLERVWIRDSLLNMLEPTYLRLKELNIKQLHFHLPDNVSFLRFHRPAVFGDDLSNIRASIAAANTKHENVTCFEEGRIFNGFRNVFLSFI
jgi:hypothetical protein